MNFREFEISDYEDALSLWKRSEGVGLRGADSREGILKYLTRNPNLSFVVTHNACIVGTIMSGHDGKRGYVQHLAVDQGFRNKGVATRLIELTLEALKIEGILKSHIHVLANNVEGKQFWLNRGWQERTDLIVCSYINGGSENT